MDKLTRWYNWRDRLYQVHVLTGLIAALWLLLVAVTGVLINHQEALGLLDIQMSDRFLPDYYRPDYRTGTTPLHIIITDFHSGRIFGAYGHWVGDGIALLLTVSLFTGAFSYWMKKRLHIRNHSRELQQIGPFFPAPKREAAPRRPEGNPVAASASRKNSPSEVRDA